MYALVKRALVGAAVVLAGAGTARAQVGLTSNGPVTVLLSATRNTSIALSTDVAAASLASITDNSTANDFTAVNVTAAWSLTGGSSIELVGWFSNPAQALANGGDLIPSSRVEGRIGAAPYAAFTNAAVGGIGQAGGSLTLWSQPVGVGNYNGLRTDALDLRLNLVGTTTVAGNYTGTLNLQAIVQ